MAKKAPAAKKQPTDGAKQLVDAIATVKRLQDFIKEHGTVEKAISVVGGVYELMELTGGYGQLKQALGIVGEEAARPQG
jgi:hypothetical protein